MTWNPPPQPYGHPRYGPPPGPAPAPAPPPPPPPPRGGRTVAKIVVGVVVGGFLLFLGLGALGAALGPGEQRTRTSAGGASPAATQAVEEPESRTLSAIDLQAGDCYIGKQLPPEPGQTQPISTVEVVPCTSEHTAQVIATITYSAGDSFPEVRDTRSAADCAAAFQEELQQGVLTAPGYDLGLITPRDERSFRASPVVACVVVHPSSTTSLMG